MRSKFLIERKLKQLKDEYKVSVKIASTDILHTMIARIEMLEWVLDKNKE